MWKSGACEQERAQEENWRKNQPKRKTPWRLMSLGQISETWQGKTLEGDWNIILMKRKVKRAWHKVLQLKVLVLEPKNIHWYYSQLPRPTLWTFKSIRLNLKLRATYLPYGKSEGKAVSEEALMLHHICYSSLSDISPQPVRWHLSLWSIAADSLFWPKASRQWNVEPDCMQHWSDWKQSQLTGLWCVVCA